MQLRDRFEKQKRGRFERLKIIFPILLAGWIPSILTLVVSYTILTRTLESKILSAPNPQAAAEQWLGSAFYSHPLIDGMFMTAPDGRLIASIPNDPAMIGKDFGSDQWREQAQALNGAFVSAVHQRLPDKRMATDIVGAVRAPDRTIVGYLGISVLVERIGRRLATIEFADQSLCEVFDQNGTALFAKDFRPNSAPVSSEGEILMKDIRESKSGHFERRGNLYSFSPIESTGWVA